MAEVPVIGHRVGAHNDVRMVHNVRHRPRLLLARAWPHPVLPVSQDPSWLKGFSRTLLRMWPKKNPLQPLLEPQPLSLYSPQESQLELILKIACRKPSIRPQCPLKRKSNCDKLSTTSPNYSWPKFFGCTCAQQNGGLGKQPPPPPRILLQLG